MKTTPHLTQRRLCIAAAAFLVALALSIEVLAQTSPPRPHASVAMTLVEPDMSREWFDLQKNEINPALKKAGIKSRTVFRNAPFNGSPYEYVSVTPFDNYGEFDQDNALIRALGHEEAERLLGKLRKCVTSTNRFVITSRPDLGNPPEPGKAPKIMVLTRYRINQGKAAEYEAYLKAEIQPVYKKANVLFAISQRGFGALGNEWTTAFYADKYADLDGGPPLIRILGQEAAAKVAAKGDPLRTVVQSVVRIRVDELSFRQP